jgi:pimeloyl-ACP methyl ester carboxylesterase
MQQQQQQYLMSEHDDPETWHGWLGRWLAGAPNRWLGRRSAVGQDIAGGADGLKYLLHLARGNRRERTSAVQQLGKDVRPVVLIHGFMGTRGSMYPLERRLEEDGFCVLSFNLGLINLKDIRTSAFRIQRKIDALLAETGVEEIDIIGHSMGGLIGLYMIKKLGAHKKVKRFILLGSPVHGTWAALAGIATVGLYSASTWQILPRSKFLDELHKGPIPGDVEVHSVSAARDWVCPPSSTRLRGSESHSVNLGHSSLVISAEVYRHVQNILKSPDVEPQEPGSDAKKPADLAMDPKENLGP